jgi:hypothetical protein
MKYLGLIFLTLVLFSCDELTDGLVDNRTRIEGLWSVDEESSVFKSTQTVYTAFIEIDSARSNRVWIEGFYDAITVSAILSGSSLSIPNQTIDGYTVISANGTISDKWDEITWEYSVDYGTGEPDEVTAIYTKQ